MEVTLKGAEIDCIHALAKCFEDGRAQWTGLTGWDELGLKEENHVQVLEMMELCGAITDATHTSGGKFYFFNISAQAVLLARKLEDQQRQSEEGKDIVEQVKDAARKHRILGPLIVAGLVAVGIITGLNQLVSLLKNLGWIQ